MALRVQRSVAGHAIGRRAARWANTLATAGVAIGWVVVAIWFLFISGPVLTIPAPQSASAPEGTSPVTPQIENQVNRVRPSPFPGFAVFDDRITLSEFDVADGRVLAGNAISVTLHWQTATDIETSYMVVMQLFDAAGNLAAQSDAIPAGGARPTTSWQPGESIEDPQRLMAPDDLASGSYQLVVGLYDPQTTEHLFTTDNQQVVELGTIEVQGISRRVVEGFGDSATLLGFDLTSDSVAAGGATELTLYWRAGVQNSAAYVVSLQVFDADKLIVSQVERALPTDLWRPGEVIEDSYSIELPEDATAGQYDVVLLMFDAVSGAQIFTGSGNGAVTLATLDVAPPTPAVTP
jgi:hypothetical protein